MRINNCKYLTIAIVRALCRYARYRYRANEQRAEIKRIYKQLIDPENKHDLPAVRALVWNSASTLFVAKAPVG
jgi:hypothetical protein